MALYQHIRLSDHSFIGEPGRPHYAVDGWSDEDLRTLDGTDERFGLRGTAFWPVAVSEPAYDPATEALTDAVTNRVVEAEAFRITGVQGKRALTAEEIGERTANSTGAINDERNRRIRSPFPYLGHPFDYDDDSQKRITGAAALARFALTLGGKQPGDLRWHDGDEDFVWIAHDNVDVPMDAPTCFGLGRAAAAWESAHVFAGKALKKRIAAGETIADVTAPEHWPA